MASQSDFELLYYFQLNPNNSFNVILDKYQNLLYSSIHSVCFNFNQPSFSAQDCFQETLISLNQALCGYQCDRNAGFSTYLFRCATSRVRQYVRHLKGFGENTSTNLISLSAPLAVDDRLTLADMMVCEANWASPTKMNDYFEFLKIVKLKLKDYDDLTLSIFRLRNMGYSYSVISQATGVSEKKVDNILQKIRRDFRKTP